MRTTRSTWLGLMTGGVGLAIAAALLFGPRRVDGDALAASARPADGAAPLDRAADLEATEVAPLRTLPVPPSAPAPARAPRASSPAPLAAEERAETEGAETAAPAIRGRVLDPWGGPVPGAMVRVRGSTNSALSGADGEFVIQNVIDGAATLWAQVPHASPYPSADAELLPSVATPALAGDRDVFLQLRRRASIEGAVVCDGEPVPCAAIRYRERGRDDEDVAFADEDGRFQLAVSAGALVDIEVHPVVRCGRQARMKGTSDPLTRLIGVGAGSRGVLVHVSASCGHASRDARADEGCVDDAGEERPDAGGRRPR